MTPRTNTRQKSARDRELEQSKKLADLTLHGRRQRCDRNLNALYRGIERLRRVRQRASKHHARDRVQHLAVVAYGGAAPESEQHRAARSGLQKPASG
jgi:hypothetical protein